MAKSIPKLFASAAAGLLLYGSYDATAVLLAAHSSVLACLGAWVRVGLGSGGRGGRELRKQAF